jgi:replication-associated recombination protein RarA
VQLPEHLELLLTDEPVLDVYSYGPWRVPDGCYEETVRRIAALLTDPRCADLRTTDVKGYLSPLNPVLYDLNNLCGFLVGELAVHGGSRANLERELFAGYLSTSSPPARLPGNWNCNSSDWFPPVGFSLGKSERCDLALELLDDMLGVFDAIEPFQPRIAAIRELARLRAPHAATDRTLARGELRQAWMAGAAEEVVAVLPELAGPLGLAEWIYTGLAAVHEQLREAAAGPEDLPTLLAGLVIQNKMADVPVQLAVIAGHDMHARTVRRHAELAADYKISDWQNSVSAWLSRALMAGQAELCRAWLDLTVRFAAALWGLPNSPSHPNTIYVPVNTFQNTLRQLFTVRRAPANPWVERVARLGAQPTAGTSPTESESNKSQAVGAQSAQDTAATAANGAGKPVSVAEQIAALGLGKDLVGQDQLVTAIREVAATEGPVRLLLAGPDGTGKRDAARELERGLKRRPITSTVWLSANEFTGLRPSEAVSLLRAHAGSTDGSALLIFESLDLAGQDERCGTALLDELHLLIDVNDELHVIGICEAGGVAALTELNPALVQRLRVARSREFTAEGYAELFRRAAAGQGARVSEEVAEQAGVRLATTRRSGNLRNARIAVTLASEAVEAARARTAAGIAAAGETVAATGTGTGTGTANGTGASVSVSTTTAAGTSELSGTENGTTTGIGTAADAAADTRTIASGDTNADAAPGELVLTVADLVATTAAGPDSPALLELAALSGLSSVKEEFELLVAQAKAAALRRRRGLPEVHTTRHMVFLGNPGTGKTTVARLLAGVLKDLGLLESGQLIEVSRGDLVGEYIGQTAPKVRVAVDQALGGVLFIDEAYALSRQNLGSSDFGQEALAELVKLMEDHHGAFVVIAAGYEQPMTDFLASNPGLASRFTATLRFADLSDAELIAAFRSFARKAGFILAEGVDDQLRELLAGLDRGPGFGNARTMRNLFDRAVAQQAKRITATRRSSTRALIELTAADLRAARAAELAGAGSGEPDERQRPLGQYL